MPTGINISLPFSNHSTLSPLAKHPRANPLRDSLTNLQFTGMLPIFINCSSSSQRGALPDPSPLLSNPSSTSGHYYPSEPYPSLHHIFGMNRLNASFFSSSTIIEIHPPSYSSTFFVCLV